MMLRDSDIREALRRRLMEERGGEAETLIKPEMALFRGSMRVDVAVINHSIHGYEFKGTEESLAELPAQRAAFGSILDRVTVVAKSLYLAQIKREVPPWWGLSVVTTTEPGAHIDFETVREAGLNLDLDPYAVAQLLWREEAIKLLIGRGVTLRWTNVSCAVLWAEVIERFTLPELCEMVRRTLRARPNWRDPSPTPGRPRQSRVYLRGQIP